MYTTDLVLTLLSFGPIYREGEFSLGPDEVLALEGVGTFHGVGVRERLSQLRSKGKDVKSLAGRVHWESTRRGHASLTTSAVLFWEIVNCSRLSSMLLVAPPFGSYLQESQRRAQLSRERILTPAELRGKGLEGVYEGVMDRCYKVYSQLVQGGVDLEDARYVLPLSSATSLYATLPLESHVYLIMKSRRGIGLVTEEIRLISSKITELAAKSMPLLLEARLKFSSRWCYYAPTDPLRPPDGLVQRLCGDGPAAEAELLRLDHVEGLEDLLRNDVAAEQVSGLVRAVTVESLSLAAYHQAIRHRTIPTTVESIVEAAEKWARSPERRTVAPPQIKSSETKYKHFMDACSELCELYQTLVDDGEGVAALYALPNAMRVRVIRIYNLFNLLSPMGFVATRTCSAAQWEERAVAYKVWREVERAAPWLRGLMGEKCMHLGYCPEREWCPIILKYHAYSDEAHRRFNEPGGA
jgi:Predicted alternative thymidylate synthase